jgi:DNA-binding GntR family transcriptional regulator
LAQQAADEIRSRIVRGDVAMGAALSENALAAELGVSKTPVREALLQLKTEGLIAVHPQRGSFVFDMTPTQIAELGELRETLELAALRLAMRRHREPLLAALDVLLEAMADAVAADDFPRYRQLDAAYHDALFEHCGNASMHECYRGFAFRVQALRGRLSVDPALNRTSLGEHREIAARIADDDAAGACDRLAAHMQGTIWAYDARRQPGAGAGA